MTARRQADVEARHLLGARAPGVGLRLDRMSRPAFCGGAALVLATAVAIWALK